MDEKTSSWRIAHLTASPFFGGPERQMIGLASAMPESCTSTFLCLMEGGKAHSFVDQARDAGHTAACLRGNYPKLISSAREVAACLRQLRADVLFTHGYKADIIGLAAARMAHVPIVMVSRGWTWATRRVRFYEAIDRLALRFADRVVCVSAGQAHKVRQARVAVAKIQVIRNAIDVSRFPLLPTDAPSALKGLFPMPVEQVVLAAGRLSPEKGFENLIEAAARVCLVRKDVGFVLVGEGPLEDTLRQHVAQCGLEHRFVFAGFRKDCDTLMPQATCLVQSSYTEGMPNVVLEAMAAGRAVVATSVGGTPELITDRLTGLLVPPDDVEALSQGVLSLLGDAALRLRLGQAARVSVESHFTFAAQSRAYLHLIEQLQPHRAAIRQDSLAEVAQA